MRTKQRMVEMSASSIKSKDAILTLGARFDQLRQQDEKLAEELKVQQKRLEALEKTQVKPAPPAAKSTSAVDVSSES